MKPLIIGAHGQIGQQLIPLLVEAGVQPKAMIRNSEQAETMKALGAETVIGDLEENFEHAFEACDSVVFTAGSGAKTGADKTILVDLWGAIKTMDAAREAGIEHFVMVSARGAEDPDQGPKAIKHYSVCKKIADDYLLTSGLAYTILRPGKLSNDSATERVTTKRPDNADDQWISRADVAHAISFCLHHQHTRGKIYPLFHGDLTFKQALT